MENRKSGFSLVEVTLALGLVAFALIALLGLIPIGLNSGRDSIDATHAAAIAQDVFSRIKANTNSANYAAYPLGTSSFFFYTAEGARTGERLRMQSTNDQPASYTTVATPADFYRAKATVSTFDQSAGYNSYDPRFVPSGGGIPTLLCATIEIRWPVNTQNGSILAATGSKTANFTFMIRKP